MTTLGGSESLVLDLTKVSQLGWFTTLTRMSPLQFEELGIERIEDQEGSWMKMISKSDLTSRMVLIRSFSKCFERRF